MVIALFTQLWSSEELEISHVLLLSPLGWKSWWLQHSLTETGTTSSTTGDILIPPVLFSPMLAGIIIYHFLMT